MARFPGHANRKGMEAALDLVEGALATLQEKVRQQQQQQPKLKDAETNTMPFHSNVPKPHQKKRKETSVLINRRPSVFSDRSRSHRHHHREETMKTRNERSTRKAQKQNKHRKSNHRSDDSLSSRNDTSNESCRSKESSTSQSILRNSMNAGKSGEYEYDSNRLHLESSVRIIDSQRGDILSKNIGSSSSKKRGNRNRERSPESSSDELLQRKYKSRLEPPQNSRSHQRSQEGGISDLRILHKDHQKEGNVQSGPVDSDSHRSQKHNQRVRSHRKESVPVSRQSYAQPTLTSKFRDELSNRKEKEEKENITPFIPCGSKSKSYHVGVIVQQELGRIKNMTPKDLEHLTVPSPSSQELGADGTGSDSEGVTEETVRRALSNIHQHIALATRHTSKN